MLDLIRKAIAKVSGDEEKIHTTREFLQLLILNIIYNRGYFKNLAFTGGTALRVIYDLQRFSEDLDFSVVNNKNYKLGTFLKNLVYELEKRGIAVDVKESAEGAVQSAMLRFKDILFPLGLSKIENQKIHIKIEIDSNPPKGGMLESSVVSKYFVSSISHFDIPSLYATKLHACFFRKYTKGRDFYDLVWYLGRKTLPNWELLNNAIKQTESKKIEINENNFNKFLIEKLNKIDFKLVREDVERFIINKDELKILDKDLILKHLSNR